MSTITIDFDGIDSIVTLARSAADEIDFCKTVIRGVSEHNDWNCKERDQIIETVEAIKKGYDQLATLSNEFATCLLQLKEDFEKFDKMIPKEYSSVHTQIGSIVSVTPNILDTNAGDLTKNAIVPINAVPISGSLETYSLANALDGIQMCNYSDIGLK